MLGLPWGVDTGVVKLFRLGVFGLSPKGSFWLERLCKGGGGTGRISSCFPPWEEGNRLVMKFDMVKDFGADFAGVNSATLEVSETRKWGVDSAMIAKEFQRVQLTVISLSRL